MTRLRYILLLVLLLPFPLLAQTGSLTGVALDNVGNTVAGATITVCAQGSPGIPCAPVTASTTSNGQGAFSMVVPVGTYTVTVFRLGVVATSSTVVVAPSNITVANTVTYTGNVTIGPGNLTVSGTLNGECPVTSTVSLSAANLICTTSSTKIHIWPGAGVVSGAGLTIAAQLQVDAGSQISGSPTVNGSILAGYYQIFSGTPVLGPVAATKVEAAWFPGADRGIQTQNAYNACPLPGCWVHEEAGIFNGMTPIQVTTAGKKLRIQGEGVKATQLNFSTLAPLTIAASGLTESGSTVTVTTTASCNNSAFAAGSFVAIINAGGGPTSAYNGVWQIVSGCTSTSFTYTNTVSGLGTVSGGTVGQAAITYAHTPVSDAYQSWGEGLYDVDVTGPGGALCGGGNAGTGIAIAGGSSGTLGLRLQNSRFAGFTLNLQQGATGSGFETFIDHDNFISCQSLGTTNIYIQNSQENIWMTNSTVTVFASETANPNDILIRGGADIHMVGNSIDGSQIVMGLGGSDGGQFDFNSNHVEDCPGHPVPSDTNPPILINTVGQVNLGPGNQYLYDCNSNGSGPPSGFIVVTFAASVIVSAPLNAFSFVTMPQFLNNTGAPAGAVKFSLPGFALTSNGFKNATSYNVSEYQETFCATTQRAETGADATLLSCAVPATNVDGATLGGTYRLGFVLSISAANAATVGWTATWTDSNGNAQTPTNLALTQSGTAAPALTFTTSAAGNYYGVAYIDLPVTASTVVLKLTFSGTSMSAKASGSLERIYQ